MLKKKPILIFTVIVFSTMFLLISREGDQSDSMNRDVIVKSVEQPSPGLESSSSTVQNSFRATDVNEQNSSHDDSELKVVINEIDQSIDSIETIDRVNQLKKYLPESINEMVDAYDNEVQILTEKRKALSTNMKIINGYILKQEDPPQDLIEKNKEVVEELRNKAIYLGKEAHQINLAFRAHIPEIIERYENEK
jgi:hypothetical protein